MRVGIQTWGTEGDLRPFFALGSALRERGHDVRVVYTSVESRDFGELAAACGIEARAVGVAYFDRHREGLVARARESFESRSPLRQVRMVLEDLLDPVADEMLAAGLELARGSDVIVTHFLTYPAQVAADRSGCAHVVVGLTPMFPTSQCAPVGVPSLGRWLHRFEWRLVSLFFAALFGPRIARLRAQVGLPPTKAPLDSSLERTRLGLVAVSPGLFPRPPDWPARADVVGAFLLPGQAEPWEPDTALAAFLDEGPPPVFLSFGSMFTLDPERAARTVRTLAEAVCRAGARGLIQAPESALRSLPDSRSLHGLVRAPHAKLFPLCSSIVHHGGAGTTHAALLAGRPSIVVPHVADQFWWADVLRRRGAAVRPLGITALTADRLALRIRETLERPALAECAAALGSQLAAERGPQRAAEWIERAVAKP